MKLERHAKIIELIGKYAIETQEELAGRLNEAGFRVTQATVSRDIRELKLTKMTVDGRQRYVIVPGPGRQLGDKYACSGMDMSPWIWPRISWWSRQYPVWPWLWLRRWTL